MFLRHGYDAEVLRNMFLKMMETHRWFEEPADAEAAEEMRSHIVLRFGQPPYPFLQVGDVPEHFLTAKGNRRRLTRDPAASEYNAMRATVVNYQSLPRSPHFVDNQQQSMERHYWLEGVDLSTAPHSIASIQEILREKYTQSDDRTVKLLFRLPIKTKKEEGYHIPVGGDTLDLFHRVDKKTTQLVATVNVTRSEIRPGSSTGFVYVTL